MKFMTALVLLLGISLNAHADVSAQFFASRQGTMVGMVKNVEDCYSIRFSDVRDTVFFRQFCLGAVVSGKLIDAVSGSSINPVVLQSWVVKNNLSAWVSDSVSGIDQGDLDTTVSYALKIISNLKGADLSQGGGSGNSSAVFYLPYPSLKESCLNQGDDRFHGALIIDFSRDQAEGVWSVSGISNFVNCRKT